MWITWVLRDSGYVDEYVQFTHFNYKYTRWNNEQMLDPNDGVSAVAIPLVLIHPPTTIANAPNAFNYSWLMIDNSKYLVKCMFVNIFSSFN